MMAIQFLLAMIVPGCVLGLAVDTVRVMLKRHKARRQECRRPQERRALEVGHA